jgi:hypothetical protein
MNTKKDDKNDSKHGIVSILLFVFGVTLIGWVVYFTLTIGFTGSTSKLFSGEDDHFEFQFIFWSTIVLIVLYFITKKKK